MSQLMFLKRICKGTMLKIISSFQNQYEMFWDRFWTPFTILANTFSRYYWLRFFALFNGKSFDWMSLNQKSRSRLLVFTSLLQPARLFARMELRRSSIDGQLMLSCCSCYSKLRHSASGALHIEVAFLLITQWPRVWLSVFTKFYFDVA